MKNICGSKLTAFVFYAQGECKNTISTLKHLLLLVFQDELLSSLLELTDRIAHHHLVNELGRYSDAFFMTVLSLAASAPYANCGGNYAQWTAPGWDSRMEC